MIEIWAPIVGYEGYYIVSNTGKVMSLDREIRDSIGKNKFVKGKVLKPSISSRGYLNISLYKNGDRITKTLHRTILETFVGTCPKGKYAIHLDANPLNNNLNNLRWATRSEIENLKIAHKTDSRGERHGKAKLTNKKVKEIRRLYTTGEYSHNDLAKDYRVAKSCIYKVIHKKTWKHI